MLVRSCPFSTQGAPTVGPLLRLGAVEVVLVEVVVEVLVVVVLVLVTWENAPSGRIWKAESGRQKEGYHS